MTKVVKFIFLICLASSCYGKDFGKQSMTFEIIEEGFVTMIKRKLAGINMLEEQRKMTSLVKERINNPAAIEGIKRAEETRVFYFDPSYVLSEDIKLPGGMIFYKAGTKVNPLDHMILERRIFFIDGRDEKQVEWLVKELAGLKNSDEIDETKVSSRENANKKDLVINIIILTGGKILELQKVLNHELYFDQAGELTTKFGIKAVPAKAIQEDKRIKITEIDIEE